MKLDKFISEVMEQIAPYVRQEAAVTFSVHLCNAAEINGSGESDEIHVVCSDIPPCEIEYPLVVFDVLPSHLSHADNSHPQ